MKKYGSKILGVLIFILGLGVMLYPIISEKINESHQTFAIAGYNEDVKKLNAEKMSGELARAVEYNTKLAEQRVDIKPNLDGSGNISKEYNDLLNVNGVMAYIRIPKIKVGLTIKHGTSDNVLHDSIGHIEGTSLPVGGESTHCFLSGHRGLPSANLFTDLDQLEKGDKFFINVLDEVLAYKIDDIAVVLPTETDRMTITKGKDYVTLVTCTPYGINSHRLLVRGTRVPYIPEETSEVTTLNTHHIGRNELILLIGAGATAVILLIMTLVVKLKK